jgi:hypothetical protein
VEEDQLTVTLRMLAEGQQMLTDILSQLDKLPAERTVKVNIASDTGAGGITGASDAVTNDVSKMNRSMQTMPGVAQETSSKVSTAMGSKGMGGAFSETRGNLNSLTGGMMGFLPMMAGMSLVSATGQFTALAKSIQQFKVMSGTSAEEASKWVGTANIYGISAAGLGMALKGLEQHQVALETTMARTHVSATAVAIATDKLKAANETYQTSLQKVSLDQEKYNLLVEKDGKNSVAAKQAMQTLETAKTHSLTVSESVLRAQNDYNKAIGVTSAAESTIQLAAGRLGIQLLDNHGKMVSQTQILMEMADAYTKTGGSAQTVSDITAILGGRAKAILPMFAQGAQGIKDAMQQTADAGLVMNDQQLKVGVTAGKTMNDIKENIKSMFVNLGTDLLPVFNYVDQHIKGFMDIAKAALLIFATVKIWKVGEGFVKDIGGLYKSITGIGSASKTLIGDLSGKGGGSAGGRIIGAQVTVAAFGSIAMGQLKEMGGLGGGNIPGGLNTVEKDAGKLTGGAGFLQMLGRIPGIGGLFGGAAAGTTAAGGLGSGLAGGIGIGTGATAGVFAAALAPIAAMFLSAQGQGMHNDSGKYKADVGPTAGLFAIPGMTSFESTGGSAFQAFFDAVHQNTTTTTIMGRKITNVSDHMNDGQGVADMGQFTNNISKMKGFSGMTVTQQQALMVAVQNGTVGSEPDLEAWLANNQIIAQTSKTTAANSASLAAAMITIAQTATQTGPSLVSNINNLASELKDTSGSSVNTAIEARNIAALYKNHTVKTTAQVSQVQSMYTGIANATGGSNQAQALLEHSLNDGQVKIGGSIQSTIDAYKIMVDEGVKPSQASAIQIAQAYKLAAANAVLLNADLQVALIKIPAPAKNLPGGGQGYRYGAAGGLIDEHVIGYGQKTGIQYHFGEAGPEALVPLTGGHGSPLSPLPVGSSGGGGGDVMIVHVSFPNSLTFLNNANQIDELSKAIESRLATVRLPHRGVRMSPH